SGLDDVLRGYTLAGTTNLVVHILPGTYDSRGTELWSPHSGWRVLGSGIDVTILHRVSTNSSMTFLGNYFEVWGENIEFADMTVDCKGEPARKEYVNAVWLVGTHHTLRRV